jgi:hypothetical protein
MITDSLAGVTHQATIRVASAVAAGTYHLTMTATGADGLASTLEITVVVS